MPNYIWYVLLVAVLNFVLSWLWYGPVFGKMWMRLSGISSTNSGMSESQKKTMMLRSMVIHFILALATAFVFYALSASLGIVVFSELLKLSLYLWVAFMVPISISSVLWEGKSWNLFFLTAGQELASLVVASIVFTFWV